MARVSTGSGGGASRCRSPRLLVDGEQSSLATRVAVWLDGHLVDGVQQAPGAISSCHGADNRRTRHAVLWQLLGS